MNGFNANRRGVCVCWLFLGLVSFFISQDGINAASSDSAAKPTRHLEVLDPTVMSFALEKAVVTMHRDGETMSILKKYNSDYTFMIPLEAPTMNWPLRNIKEDALNDLLKSKQVVIRSYKADWGNEAMSSGNTLTGLFADLDKAVWRRVFEQYTEEGENADFTIFYDWIEAPVYNHCHAYSSYFLTSNIGARQYYNDHRLEIFPVFVSPTYITTLKSLGISSYENFQNFNPKDMEKPVSSVWFFSIKNEHNFLSYLPSSMSGVTSSNPLGYQEYLNKLREGSALAVVSTSNFVAAEHAVDFEVITLPLLNTHGISVPFPVNIYNTSQSSYYNFSTNWFLLCFLVIGIAFVCVCVISVLFSWCRRIWKQRQHRKGPFVELAA